MQLARRALRWALARFGLAVSRRPAAAPQAVVNLCALARAYESLLEATGAPPLPPDERRLELLPRLLGTPPPEAYGIISALAATSHLEGAVCEFGVAQGETSALIANEIIGGGRHLHLFDSFAGLPAPSDKDILIDDIFGLGSMDAYTATMAVPRDLVLARLRAVGFPTDRCAIHAGFFADVLRSARDLPGSVSFAYVDFDLYDPIRLALEFLDSVLQPDGIVIIDDYGFFTTGAKHAVDEFLASPQGRSYSCHVPDPRIGHFAVIERRRMPG